MAHHSNDRPFDSSAFDDKKEQFAELMEKLGPTGKFPDGKIADHDEGEIAIAVGIVDGRIVINFGKPIASIGFTREQAVDLADTLTRRSKGITDI